MRSPNIISKVFKSSHGIGYFVGSRSCAFELILNLDEFGINDSLIFKNFLKYFFARHTCIFCSNTNIGNRWQTDNSLPFFKAKSLRK